MNPFCHGLPGLLALELDAESQTGASMTLAHVLAPAITMQDAGAWVVSQSLDECDVGQHTTMVRTELSAQDLAGREIHDECQVVHTTANTQVGEILRPGISLLGHRTIIHAVLRTGNVLE